MATLRYDRWHAWGALTVEGLLAILAFFASLGFHTWGWWSWVVLSAALTLVLLAGAILAGRDLTRRSLDSPSRVPISRIILDLIPLTVSGIYFVGTLMAAEYGWVVVTGLLLSASLATLLAGLAANTARIDFRRDAGGV
jgi:hypothetical protein